MNTRFWRSVLWLSWFVISLLVLGCSSDGAQQSMSTGGNAGAGGSPAETGGTAGQGTGAGELSLSETALTFAAPDQRQPLTATLDGMPTSAVTWTSSNTYIATVSPAGQVFSVSGGQAVITATSTADPNVSATASVTVAEPDRARASTYVDAKSVTSGPVNILMCGDSLMRTYVPSNSDQTGWGQVLSQFLSSDVTVDNSIANGGRSTRSFYNEAGRWNIIKMRLAAAQAAGTPTFVFIMFGHNDQKKATDTNGADYLTFASENQNGTVAGTYYDYLERYIVEARELGGIPILLTPFVRAYLAGTPPRVTTTGQHDITVPYAGETTARGDYPAAMKAIAEKHDVPVIDITTWSKGMVEAHAADDTLGYVYIEGDQTHIRELGALLMAEEVVRALNEQGILSQYVKSVAPRLMLDSSTLAFGGLYADSTLDKTFRISAFGDASGTITIDAPSGYTVSLDGEHFDSSLTIDCDATYTGSVVTVRFSPTEAAAYNAELSVTHTSLELDYGNTPPNAQPGIISLTGNGKVPVSGTPATATWAMVSGTAIVMDAEVSGAISAEPATLTGLVNKNVANSAARFDVPGGAWPAEGARNEARYVEFTLPVSSGTFTLDEISLSAGTGGGSNIRWDVAYSLSDDFGSPTALETAIVGAKDTLVRSSYPGLGVNVEAGKTLRLRVYPYSTAAAASGKSLLVANVVVSGVTN
ncbi:MAG TPA: GDSL-type esterase/lipase family protein [Polyangiaceae bacterium]|nr:GDSL-type esterase/lipase family protein [Polyangiaceae bacterium]